MVEPIPVNLPRLGEVECEECDAPGGVHTGTCMTAWRTQIDGATNEVHRARLRREYRDVCKRYGIDPGDL